MEQYTDLQIVDCNRLNSVQSKTGNNENPALFTNDIGTIQLNVGDEVSIHGGFISEVGAGSDTIELKGNVLYDYKGRAKTKTLRYTKETFKFPTRDYESSYENIMGGFQMVTSEEVDSDPITLKDNEVTIQTEFWTSNNGAGYCFLPRRFAYNENYTGNASRADAHELWTDLDDTENGKTFNYPRYQTIIPDDFQYYRNGRSYGDKYAKGLFVPKNDNKRFTIMRRSGDTFFRDIMIRYEDITPVTPTLPASRDPALSNYIIYKKLVNIKVNAGMNSPSDVSEQITRSLKKGRDPLVFSSLDNTGVTRHITTTYETETWKPFTCGTYETFGNTYYQDYYNGSNTDFAYKYFASYQNIAVKRPDLFRAGRECNGTGGQEIKEQILHANALTATIKTDYLYNEVVLKRLSELFKIQGYYPELFEGEAFETHLQRAGSYNTIDNVRFLHMNTDTTIRQNFLLGNDSYGSDPAGSGIDGYDYSSIPIFFKYMPEYADVETGGDDITKLSYGFATRYYHAPDNEYYIELHPELVGGIPDFNFSWYNYASSTYEIRNIEDTRRIGWDYHFSAYSTLAMILWGGRLDRDYLNNNEWAIQNASQVPLATDGTFKNISHLLTQRYVGTPSILFDYDQVNSRFYFSDLHNSERAGQSDILAGISAEGAPAINPNYDEKVYKINPRFNRWEYTPDLKPYSDDYDVEYHAGMPSYIKASDIQGFKLMSRQVSPFTIFDSDSGIFISDFGYNEDDFDEGLWSILGFTYEQFNQKTSSELNRLTRVDEDNKTSLSIVTTNSKIVSTDTEFFNVNNYGAIFLNNQVTAPQCIVGPTGFKIDGNPTTYGQQSVPSFPAITQPQTSIRISGVNLPRKMLRPYYLIKSDIIEQPKYVGNNNSLMSVVGICDKQYSGGDFYFGSDNAFVFRITKPRTITQITTSIHDPDGSFAEVNKDSAIIYRITKNIKVNTDILGDFLSKKK